MECLVEFDYKAEEEDELTLVKGERITGVVTMHDGWWEGTLNGKRGLFPDNFVKVITANSGSSEPKPGDGDAPKMRQKSGPNLRRLKAIFSYAPVQDDELRLDVGDVIHFMDEIEEGWFKGELNGRVGIFPSNFVAEVDKDNNLQNGNTVPEEKKEEKARNRDTYIAKTTKVIPDIIPAYSKQSKDDEVESAPKLPPKPVRETARCFYPYFAANEDELTLQEGDIVTIVSKECEDEGWWRGELRGKIGVFPDNFVEVIIPNSPTTALPAANQPKVTAQERIDDSKKEIRHPGPGSLPVGSGSSVVDGSGASKPSAKAESKVASQIKAFAKKDSPTTKGPAPLSPISPLASAFGGFSIKREAKSPQASSPLTDNPTADELNLNSIERSEKLNHLTVSRAKAPKRRPPSAIITREEEHEFGLMNGTSGTVSLPMQSVKESDQAHARQSPQVAPPPFARSNSHTIHVPDGTQTPPLKETSPGPQSVPTSAVNKPKAAIPWMAELKLKQDTKKSTGLASPTTPTSSSVAANNNNISTVIVAPPAAANIMSSSATGLIQTKAPPLPVKPNIPAPITTPTPAPSVQPVERTAQPIPASNQTPIAAIPAPTPSKFGIGALKRNASNPTPPTNHVNQTGVSGNGEFVTIEEYNQLKEKVVALEHELEAVKRQLKGLISERDFKGLIV